MGINYSPKIVTNGLVLCLDAANSLSYPGSGTVWTDLSGNGNNGTLTNGPTYSSANRGSIVFDGTNDNIDLPSLGSFTVSSTLSIEAWVYPTIDPTTNKEIVSQYSTGSLFNCGLSSNNSKYLFAYVSRLNLGADITYDTTPYSLNNWYCLTGLYDGSFVWLYVNGIFKSKAAYSNALTATSNNSVWYIGKLRQLSTDYYYWNGRIPNVKIYNRVLTASEVLQNYNATKGRFNL